MAMMEQKFVLNNGDTIDYAFAQVINKYKGLKSASHSGGDAGYRSFLLRFPEQKFSVAVFSNQASFSTWRISYEIADLYLKDLLKEEPKKENQPPAPEEKKDVFDPKQVKLADYTGRFYSDELETYYEFEVKNDTLVAHHARHNDFKLTPKSKDSFEAEAWWMGNLQFTRNGAGKVTGMKASNGRVVDLVFVKEAGR